jgi:hypothetical protein
VAGAIKGADAGVRENVARARASLPGLMPLGLFDRFGVCGAALETEKINLGRFSPNPSPEIANPSPEVANLSPEIISGAG